MWIPPLVTEGRTVAEVGDELSGDLLGDDPQAAWERAAAAGHAAFAAPGALDRTITLSYGPTRGSAYCSELTADCVVHTWDLSRAIGADDRLPADLVEFSIKEVMPYADGLAASGMYAQPLEVPAGADAQTRLLALLGRRGKGEKPDGAVTVNGRIGVNNRIKGGSIGGGGGRRARVGDGRGHDGRARRALAPPGTGGARARQVRSPRPRTGPAG
ncbi:conserved hypothetical protein, partial [Streptomyces sp. C]